MKRGRKKISCNRERIAELASNMCTNEEIAADQGVSSDTIVRNFAESIKKGHELAKLSLRARQFGMAMGTPAQYARNKDGSLVLTPEGKPILLREEIKPNATMQIWLGKQYLDQKDHRFNEESDAEGFAFVVKR